MEILQVPIVIFMLVMPVLLFIWLSPAIYIKRSNRAEGIEKVLWVFLATFFSWLALIIYFVLSPISTSVTTQSTNG